MISALAFGINGAYSSWAKIAKANSRLERFLVMDRMVDSAFKNAVPFTWRDDNGHDRFIFKGDSSELILSYLHRINNIEDGGMNFLRLSLENGNLIAEYRKTPILWWEDDCANVSKEIILNSVKTISFLYADKKNDEVIWSEDWDEEKAMNIPLAIQIKVEFEDTVEELWLRRTAGSGLRETYGMRRSNP
jgi:hypothetical protein